MTDLSEQLIRTTEAMANRCSAPMDLWCEHSGAALEAAALIASQAARIRELEDGLAWVEPAMHALTSYEKDCGEPLAEDHQIGKIDDSRNSASFRLYVGNIRRMHSLLSRKGGE